MKIFITTKDLAREYNRGALLAANHIISYLEMGRSEDLLDWAKSLKKILDENPEDNSHNY